MNPTRQEPALGSKTMEVEIAGDACRAGAGMRVARARELIVQRGPAATWPAPAASAAKRSTASPNGGRRGDGSRATPTRRATGDVGEPRRTGPRMIVTLVSPEREQPGQSPIRQRFRARATQLKPHRQEPRASSGCLRR